MSQPLKSTLLALCSAWCLFGGAVATASDTMFSVRYQGIVHDALYDLCFRESEGFAVGVAGTLFRSDDQGMSWQPLAPLGAGALLGLHCGAAGVLAVGQGGAIYLEEGGKWQTIDSGTDARLLDISVNSQGLAIAVGGFGTVLRSRDGGRSWSPLAFDWESLLNDFLEPHIYDVEVADDGVITIVGEFALILRSSDGGESWEMVHRGDPSLFALEIQGQTGYAVGQSGMILRTADGGQTWSQIASGTGAILTDVLVDGEGGVHVTGIRALLSSNDGGQTWVADESGDVPSRWYQSLGLSKSGVFMVGHSGRIVQIK